MGVVRDYQILDTFQRSKQHDGFIDRRRFDVGCERKEEIRDHNKIWGLSSRKNGVDIY